MEFDARAVTARWIDCLDVTAVCLSDRLHDRESEAGSSRCSGASRISAMEALEHALALGDWYPGSVVDDRELDLLGASPMDL